MTFDQRQFRDVLGCFATGVTIITARDRDGAPVGLTVNSFSSVSLDPPLILFSLDKAANSVDAFGEGAAFNVNVLTQQQQAQSNHFASKVDDKFATTDFDWQTAANECLLLNGALAHLQCTCEAVHEGGDHWIIIGRVTAIESQAEGAPLLYFRGRYADLKGEW